MKWIDSLITIFCIILVFLIVLADAGHAFLMALSGIGDPARTADFDYEGFRAVRQRNYLYFCAFLFFLVITLFAGVLLLTRTLFSRFYMMIVNACQISLYAIVFLPINGSGLFSSNFIVTVIENILMSGLMVWLIFREKRSRKVQNELDKGNV